MSENTEDDTGEIEIDPDVAAHEWRRSVSRALNRQARLEAERTGASKTTSKIIAVFGSIITAAALGGFGWLWNTQAKGQEQQAQIVRMGDTQEQHSTQIEETETDVDAISDRVTQNESAIRSINERLDRILEELRQQRANTRRN